MASTSHAEDAAWLAVADVAAVATMLGMTTAMPRPEGRGIAVVDVPQSDVTSSRRSGTPLLGGYALARFKFRGKGAFLVMMLCTQFVPGAMMLIPLFEIFRTTHLINSLWSIVVADTVFHLPLSLILMAGFIRNIPIELEEASWIDGCKRFRGFLAVALPLLRPGIVAISSFAFIASWNNFLFALMFLNRQDQFTVPVGLSYMLGEFGVDFGALAAGGVVAVVPVVIVFAYVQKFLVQGLAAGAVKG